MQQCMVIERQVDETIPCISSHANVIYIMCCELCIKEITERYKGAWGMPWLSEATKDVISCDKRRRGANTR